MKGAASFEGCKMIMLQTHLDMSVQIMDNVKYSEFLLMAIINKLMGLRCSGSQINV